MISRSPIRLPTSSASSASVSMLAGSSAERLTRMRSAVGSADTRPTSRAMRSASSAATTAPAGRRGKAAREHDQRVRQLVRVVGLPRRAHPGPALPDHFVEITLEHREAAGRPVQPEMVRAQGFLRAAPAFARRSSARTRSPRMKAPIVAPAATRGYSWCAGAPGTACAMSAQSVAVYPIGSARHQQRCDQAKGVVGRTGFDGPVERGAEILDVADEHRRPAELLAGAEVRAGGLGERHEVVGVAAAHRVGVTRALRVAPAAYCRIVSNSR